MPLHDGSNRPHIDAGRRASVRRPSTLCNTDGTTGRSEQCVHRAPQERLGWSWFTPYTFSTAVADDYTGGSEAATTGLDVGGPATFPRNKSHLENCSAIAFFLDNIYCVSYSVCHTLCLIR